VLAVDRRSRTR